jgi:hypothetical protein
MSIVTRQLFGEPIPLAMSAHTTIGESFDALFPVRYASYERIADDRFFQNYM